jgi:uncharacterized protein YkwD
MKKTTSIVQHFVLVALLVIGQYSMAIGVKHQRSVSVSEQQTMILYYVNQYRIKHHLAPFKMSRIISKEAEKHSKNMAKHKIPFGHEGFNGRIKRLYRQVKNCNGGAENVAYYKVDAKKLVEQWIASPGHRRNIEGPYNVTGIGIAYGKKGWAYYTQIFLRSNDTKIA